jgi:hypothetical protein
VTFGDPGAEHLRDEARLAFEALPHVRVEGAFGDVAVQVDEWVEVARAQPGP